MIEGFGLILGRCAGQSVAILGPGTVHFLGGQYEAIVLSRQGDQAPVVVGESVVLHEPAVLIVTKGRARLGIKAEQSTRILRGELINRKFARNPFVAALVNMDWDDQSAFEARSELFSVTQIRRDALCPTAA